ncbi:MAG: hypothetical protein EHM78_27235 [Myxococcaceae bacterium]|nr:MAG: hypothetical protein EHM78_27235 [Myxococcaceae bacterium]
MIVTDEQVEAAVRTWLVSRDLNTNVARFDRIKDDMRRVLEQFAASAPAQGDWVMIPATIDEDALKHLRTLSGHTSSHLLALYRHMLKHLATAAPSAPVSDDGVGARQDVRWLANYKARLIVETLYDEPPQRWTADMKELATAIEKAIFEVAAAPAPASDDVKAENEACAKLVEEIGMEWQGLREGVLFARAAAAIRARSES